MTLKVNFLPPDAFLAAASGGKFNSWQGKVCV